MIAYASAGAKVRSLTRFTAFRQIVFERDKDLPAIAVRINHPGVQFGHVEFGLAPADFDRLYIP